MTPVLVPYVQVNGAYSLSDDDILRIWNVMVEFDLTRRVFYTGEISTPEQFLEAMKRKSNVVHTIWDQDEKICIMIAWLNNWQKNSAFAHFCILPGGYGANSVPLGRMCLEHWFSFTRDGARLLDVICGKTPDNNRAATIYLRRMGMHVLGTIPFFDWDNYEQKKIGSVLSYITAEDLQNGRLR